MASPSEGNEHSFERDIKPLFRTKDPRLDTGSVKTSLGSGQSWRLMLSNWARDASLQKRCRASFGEIRKSPCRLIWRRAYACSGPGMVSITLLPSGGRTLERKTR
jgi:hypothetical protein